MIDQKTENPEVKGEAKRPLLPPFTKESPESPIGGRRVSFS